jgi:hypothetical protein
MFTVYYTAPYFAKFVGFRIIALMLRMDVKTAIKHYDELPKQVFSDIKPWGEVCS